MEIDEDKADDAVLALLRLTLHGQRAWKGFDWEALRRLHRKGMISDLVGKSSSVVLTNEGLRRSEGHGVIAASAVWPKMLRSGPVCLCVR